MKLLPDGGDRPAIYPETFLAAQPAAAAAAASRRADALICGVPWDAGSSFRFGPAGGPAAIRAGSHVLETYSHAARRDLGELALVDAGDWDPAAGPAPGDRAGIVADIAGWTGRLVECHLAPDGVLVVFGGDHLITVPVIRALADRAAADGGPAPCVLVLDAHADLRDDWDGEPLSHACVTTRLQEILGPERVEAAGVRSVAQSEVDGRHQALAWGRRETAEPADLTTEALAALAGLPPAGPIFLSVDIDVCDPAAAPGVGAPEPGGVDALTLIRTVREIARAARGRLVGLDVVEVSPAYDPAGATATLAAKLVREVLLGRLAALPAAR